MRESGIGRVLVASLHQAIGDVLPMRLGFYESWLNAEGLREGTIGLAPLYAVLSFLRQEGPAYDRVVAAAGGYAAEWTVESMNPTVRRFVNALPRVLRRRVVLGRARRLVRMSYEGSRASWRIRKGVGQMKVIASVFCSVREPHPAPLCGFYAAAVERMLALFAIDARVSVSACRGSGGEVCTLDIPMNAASPDSEVVAA